jgi:hypothetical protein
MQRHGIDQSNVRAVARNCKSIYFSLRYIMKTSDDHYESEHFSTEHCDTDLHGIQYVGRTKCRCFNQWWVSAQVLVAQSLLCQRRKKESEERQCFKKTEMNCLNRVVLFLDCQSRSGGTVCTGIDFYKDIILFLSFILTSCPSQLLLWATEPSVTVLHQPS